MRTQLHRIPGGRLLARLLLPKRRSAIVLRVAVVLAAVISATI
jgi:hypothetical protein